MESSSARRMQSGSQSGSRRRLASPPQSTPDDQPTVITGRAPQPATPTADAEQTTGATAIGPGSLLSHFELAEPIGGGGMGRVFRATDTRLGRTVALKVLSRQQASDVETLLRFHNEARAAARLNHENIAQVYYVGEDKGFPFIALEFIDGCNIRDLVQRKGPLPLAEAVSYALQVAEALRHAAEHMVVHRDVKPSNVLVSEDGHAKLIDLGLARLISRDDSGSDLTASGVTLGTFDYISPEQARDPRIADVRSDIYSLGCTLFYMLAGRPPFPQGTVLQKLLQHQGDDPPDVRVFRPELPEDVARVVRKMMAKDPRRRYRDPSRLIVALLSLAEQIGLRPMGLGSVAWMVPKERKLSVLQRHMPWAAPAAVLVLIVLALDLVWSPQGEPDEPSLPDVAVSTGQSPGQTTPDKPGTPTLEQPDANAPAQIKPTTDSQPQTIAVSTADPQGDAARGHATASAPQAGEPPVAEDAMPRPPPNDSTAVSLGNPGSAGKTPSQGDTSGGTLRPNDIQGQLSAAEFASAGLSVSRDMSALWANAETSPSTDDGPTTDDDPPDSPENRRRWTVDPHNPGSADFSTLTAAAQAAADGDVIELRFDGRLASKPITLANMEVTIEAGQGFQPIVAFEPTEADPIKYPRSMFSLTGTQLTLNRVALELTVPREVLADSWTLFEMGRVDQVRLQGCLLTIRNNSPVTPGRQTAYHPDVAFFRVKTFLGSDIGLGTGAGAGRRASVGLNDCVVRGEAAVLRLEDLQPIDLNWTNGLLLTTDWLLVAVGGERAPLAGDTIKIRLEKLTASLGAGLCQLSRSQFAPYQLTTQIECNHCLLTTPEIRPGVLVEQIGVDNAAEGRGELDWQSHHSVYSEFAPFWRLRPFDPAVSPLEMAFDQWQSEWTVERESSVLAKSIPWAQPRRPEVPVSAQTTADYLLTQDAAAGSTEAAGFDGEVGVDAGQLPTLAPGALPTPAESTSNR